MNELYLDVFYLHDSKHNEIDILKNFTGELRLPEINYGHKNCLFTIKNIRDYTMYGDMPYYYSPPGLKIGTYHYWYIGDISVRSFDPEKMSFKDITNILNEEPVFLLKTQKIAPPSDELFHKLSLNLCKFGLINLKLDEIKSGYLHINRPLFRNFLKTTKIKGLENAENIVKSGIINYS